MNPGQTRPMEMGCYGIGVSRIVAAAIEQSHDERGIIFPAPMAPFQVAIVPIGLRKSERSGMKRKSYTRTFPPPASMFCLMIAMNALA